ncbi:MAG: hypothetical protein QXV69_01560 [Sulfolobaceae archaeon]
MNRVIRKIIDLDNVLLVSYYKNFNIKFALEVARALEHVGEKICIKTSLRIPLNIQSICEEDAKKILIEVESESDLEKYFKFATSYKILKNVKYIIKANKVRQNIFKVQIENNYFLVRVTENEIIDEDFGDLEKIILNTIKDWDNNITMKDIMNIITYKIGISKNEIKNALLFLKSLGIIEIKNGIIKLNKEKLFNNNSWS